MRHGLRQLQIAHIQGWGGECLVVGFCVAVPAAESRHVTEIGVGQRKQVGGGYRTGTDGGRSPVLPARRSEAALTKVHDHTLPDGCGAHSFRTLLDSLSTIVRSTHTVPRTGGEKAETMIEVTTRPDASQARALKLLKEIAAM